VTPCCLVDRYQRLGITYYLCLQGTKLNDAGMERIDRGRLGRSRVAGGPEGFMSLEGARNFYMIFTFLCTIICHWSLICHYYDKGRKFLTNVETKYTRLYCFIPDNCNIHPLCHGTLNVTRIYNLFRMHYTFCENCRYTYD
jgi:hypothetical protein